MNKDNPYVLATGIKASSRLALLDEIYGPYSHQFIHKIGIKPGMSVLDVGCGTGNITCWLAKEVGATGRVIGIDASENQINVAKENARTQNLTNIEFYPYSVYDIEKINATFDIVYSRFLLIHIEQPLVALKLMYSLVKSGGVLACDEQCLAAALTYPESRAFTDSKNLAEKICQQKNIDFNFGQKLYPAFKKFDFTNVTLQVIQPTLTSSNHKMLWLLFFEETRDNFIKSGLITENKFNEMLEGIKEIVNDENSYILPMRNFQISGKKK
jgi:ubiquinone/menaquinone biosynthesis C-methylase UbiE